MKAILETKLPDLRSGKLIAIALLCLAGSPALAEEVPLLTAYEGKYPHDATLPHFLMHPLVRAAVERVVPDAEVRQRILAPGGPKTPIWIANGRIQSWGCEAHRCGPHNWMISMELDGSAPEICYHEASSLDAGARWYREGESEVRDYQCPAEEPGSRE